MKSTSSFLFLVLFLFSSICSFLLPFSAEAALVPCGRSVDDTTTTIDETKPCTVCHLVIGGKGVIDYAIKIMTYVAIAVIVAMAILYIVSTGNDGMMQTAKSGIKASLIGFAVILGAWLIINTTLRVLTATIPGLTVTSSGFGFTCDPNSSSAGSATSGGSTRTPTITTSAIALSPTNPGTSSVTVTPGGEAVVNPTGEVTPTQSEPIVISVTPGQSTFLLKKNLLSFLDIPTAFSSTEDLNITPSVITSVEQLRRGVTIAAREGVAEGKKYVVTVKQGGNVLGTINVEIVAAGNGESDPTPYAGPIPSTLFGRSVVYREADSEGMFQTNYGTGDSAPWSVRSNVMYLVRFKTDKDGAYQLPLQAIKSYGPSILGFVSPTPGDYTWAYQKKLFNSMQSTFDIPVLTSSQAKNFFGNVGSYASFYPGVIKEQNERYLLPNKYYYFHIVNASVGQAKTSEELTNTPDSCAEHKNGQKSFGGGTDSDKCDYLLVKVWPPFDKNRFLVDAYAPAGPPFLPFPWMIDGKSYASLTAVKEKYVPLAKGIFIDGYGILPGWDPLYGTSSPGGTPVDPSGAKSSISKSPDGPWTEGGSVYYDEHLYIKTTGLTKASKPKACVDTDGVSNGCTTYSAAAYREFTADEWINATAVRTHATPGSFRSGTYGIYVYYAGTGVRKIGTFEVKQSVSRQFTCSTFQACGSDALKKDCCPKGTISACQKVGAGGATNITGIDCGLPADPTPATPARHYSASQGVGSTWVWYGSASAGGLGSEKTAGSECVSENVYYSGEGTCDANTQREPNCYQNHELGKECLCYSKYIQNCQ